MGKFCIFWCVICLNLLYGFHRHSRKTLSPVLLWSKCRKSQRQSIRWSRQIPNCFTRAYCRKKCLNRNLNLLWQPGLRNILDAWLFHPLHIISRGVAKHEGEYRHFFTKNWPTSAMFWLKMYRVWNSHASNILHSSGWVKIIWESCPSYFVIINIWKC